MSIRTSLPVIASGLIRASARSAADRLFPSHASAHQAPSMIQVRRFEVIDDADTIRVALRMEPAEPILRLTDPSWPTPPWRSADDRGTYAISINAPDGTPCFGIGSTPREGGFACFDVRDVDEVIRTRCFASDYGTQTGFQVQDSPNELRAEMAMSSRHHRVRLQVRDATGDLLWRVS